MTPKNIEALSTKLRMLQAALANGASPKQRLHRWSEFIRERDGHRCVDCHATRGLSAHHICRKSLLPVAQFETGNGITLCGACHRAVHEGFNQRPDLEQPIDAQGGEKLEKMERLFSILTDDAVERALTVPDFYHLSADVLATLKQIQGYDRRTEFPGAPIEQAYLILAECEYGLRHSALRAESAPMPDRPLLPGGLYLVFSEGPLKRGVVVQTYQARWPDVSSAWMAGSSPAMTAVGLGRRGRLRRPGSPLSRGKRRCVTPPVREIPRPNSASARRRFFTPPARGTPSAPRRRASFPRHPANQSAGRASCVARSLPCRP